jgi:hypothetical protein
LREKERVVLEVEGRAAMFVTVRCAGFFDVRFEGFLKPWRQWPEKFPTILAFGRSHRLARLITAVVVVIIIVAVIIISQTLSICLAVFIFISISTRADRTFRILIGHEDNGCRFGGVWLCIRDSK